MPIEKTANFIRIRVANPKRFIRFAVKTIGKGIKAVIGFKKGGGSQIQSLLFPRSRYTLKTAKAWIKSHGYKISESYLVYEIIVGESYLEWEEERITPEMEKEMELTEIPLPSKPVSKTLSDLPKEKIRWLFR